jgi:hypothetical protein
MSEPDTSYGTDMTANPPATSYTPAAGLLGRPVLNAPDTLDSLDFEYQGVTFRVFGVLHGITGGANKDYIAMVNRTILNAPGLRLGEKEMTRLYVGLDDEVHDWRQIPLRDAFCLGLSLVCTPMRLATVVRCIAKELLTKHDKALTESHLRLQDLGGSAAFHKIEPYERRTLAGFLPPSAYLEQNLARRAYRSQLKPPVFPDPDWAWLSFIERYANIPCRSLHMLHYATTFAKEKGHREVSMFVGEMHNTDMHWFATSRANEFESDATAKIQKILITAEMMAKDVASAQQPASPYRFRLTVWLDGTRCNTRVRSNTQVLCEAFAVGGLPGDGFFSGLERQPRFESCDAGYKSRLLLRFNYGPDWLVGRRRFLDFPLFFQGDAVPVLLFGGTWFYRTHCLATHRAAGAMAATR